MVLNAKIIYNLAQKKLTNKSINALMANSGNERKITFSKSATHIFISVDVKSPIKCYVGAHSSSTQ